MKTLIKTIILTVATAFIMNGCAAISPVEFKAEKPISHEITIVKEKNSEKYYFYYQKRIQRDQFDADLKIQMNETFYTAASLGKKNGYKYFALVNDKINNLQGYPINTVEGLLKYATLKNKANFKVELFNDKGYAVVKDSHIDLRIIYVKDAIPGMFLFSCDDVIEETSKAL